MICLCHAAVSPATLKGKGFFREAGGSGDWLYLGRDYLCFRNWRQALGPSWEHREYSKELQSLALEWRGPYLDWITGLGRKNNTLAWWTSSVSERNTYGNSLYHSICYLRIGLSVLGSERPPSLVLVESAAVLHALAGHPGLAGRVRVLNSRTTRLKEMCRWMVSWGRYFIRTAGSVWNAYVTRHPGGTPEEQKDRPRVLIHTCIDDSYFGEDGVARDRYFGTLARELRGRGYDVVVLPWIYSLRRSQREAFRWFRQHPGEYLLPEDFCSLRDYVWSAGIIMRQGFMLKGQHVFLGMDITGLVREACRQQGSRTETARFVLYYRLVQHMLNRRVRLDRFIDMHENMVTEKPQIMAFREFMPWVTVVGFQHYSESIPLMLCLFTTPEEAEFAPHPDYIVCNSPHMLSRMEQMGYPRDRLRVGPSLRYQHLVGESASAAPEGNKVLVVLPLGRDYTAEMMDLLLEGFSEPEGLEFWLKPHPMLEEKELRIITRDIPEHFTVVEGNMDRWLGRAACVVVSGSTSSFEAALAGIPVVVVGRRTDLDLNPLSWFSEFAPAVHSSRELRDGVLHALSVTGDEMGALTVWAEKMREQAISAITDETVGAFMEQRGEKRRAS